MTIENEQSSRRRRRDRRDRTSEAIHPAPVTAILVDGGFYRKRAAHLFGKKDPTGRAQELIQYCKRHLNHEGGRLYRIFYYDCPPSDKVVFHPLTREQVNLAKSDDYQWMKNFHQELTKKRKLALRWGENLETQNGYQMRPEPLKRLLSGKIKLEELTEHDFFWISVKKALI